MTAETKPSLVARAIAYPLIAAMIITPIAAVAAIGFVIVHFIKKFW